MTAEDRVEQDQAFERGNHPEMRAAKDKGA